MLLMAKMNLGTFIFIIAFLINFIDDATLLNFNDSVYTSQKSIPYFWFFFLNVRILFFDRYIGNYVHVCILSCSVIISGR